MDLFLVCICLVVAALALDRAIGLPSELRPRQRTWIQVIWLIVAVLWIAMAIRVEATLWPGL